MVIEGAVDGAVAVVVVVEVADVAEDFRCEGAFSATIGRANDKGIRRFRRGRSCALRQDEGQDEGQDNGSAHYLRRPQKKRLGITSNGHHVRRSAQSMAFGISGQMYR